MDTSATHFSGLSAAAVEEARKQHGYNRLTYKKQYRFVEVFKSLFKDPMIILLLVTAAVYFVTGKQADATFMMVAIVMVSAISIFQETRSRNAMEQLKQFTQPFAKVLRGGELLEVKSEDLVVGDYLVVEEGAAINADAVIVEAHDCSVNESILTGESLNVYKTISDDGNKLFAGTTVASGRAVAVISAIGNETKLGKIGKSLDDIKEEKTPLENEIGDFVKKMVMAGAVVFVGIWVINFLHTQNALSSLLNAMTLAMSILPEEIPVALATFMALGAWRMMKIGILVKNTKTVETLGSATVICTDKTGTLTENEMSLAGFFALKTDKVSKITDTLSDDEKELIRLAMLASEPTPFDPMELALHHAYEEIAATDERPGLKLVHEYPLGGTPPMMTHVHENGAGTRTIAAKGAPEALIQVSKLSAPEKERIQEVIKTLANEGYRLLGVAETADRQDGFPEKQEDYEYQFKGIVAFYDPPKKNIAAVLQQFYKAGISVKIITGDNAVTTNAIAKQIGFKGLEQGMSGDEVMKLPDVALQKVVSGINIFTRMFPEAKLKVINALKANQEIVAMTGDGVNDGPALKAAHIGIAMGKKGTETARDAASLILLDDDLSKMIDAVGMGRRIYANLKKAIQYIMSIHIPIILTVIVPLTLRWIYPNIFSPIHIIFFELIMGPTCSIIYENEPIEKNIMSIPPRVYKSTFFNFKELATSILQGLFIAFGTLAIYTYSANMWASEAATRTMVFTTMISANIFLTLVNRSFYYSVLTTLKYKNNLIPLLIGVTICMCGLILIVPPVRAFFQFVPLNLFQLSVCILAGFLSVIWFEGIKLIRRLRKPAM